MVVREGLAGVNTGASLTAVAVALSENSEVSPYVPPPKSTVAVAVTNSPAVTEAVKVVLKVPFPPPSVVTVVNPK